MRLWSSVVFFLKFCHVKTFEIVGELASSRERWSWSHSISREAIEAHVSQKVRQSEGRSESAGTTLHNSECWQLFKKKPAERIQETQNCLNFDPANFGNFGNPYTRIIHKKTRKFIWSSTSRTFQKQECFFCLLFWFAIVQTNRKDSTSQN